MRELDQQLVLITGATGNLGRATASAFARRGARLALLARDPEALERTRNELEPTASVDCLACDLLDPTALHASLAQLLERHGRLDTLANLAGGFAMGRPLHQTNDADWDRMLDINARTLLHSARAAVPHLLAAGGGAMINVSARAARPAGAHMGPYSAAKAAVIALTETLSAELRDQHINVNCILPGTVDTPENRAAMPDQDPSAWVTPAAIAEVIVFLASPAARAITGAAIPVYGRS
ncbi:SDR family oxidoreductase [Marichromatium bheemlicum]|uniref:SDR family oxidoreductase n=1 Tax=Marichromatium bheemlicum TaxID=365339 RepID=A0ABX1I4X4_9GAMM|nr:SDR family NAD(P)-dependent oxidoreductase [Marichromatium bheemlicum]NKN32268.1 SDR family oxidoreductase [Marichromatium bheemlicum]